MMTDRFLKILAWFYIAALVAVSAAHLNLQVELGNPFNVYRVLVLGLAGMLARMAYPLAPSLACLMMIGCVCGLGVAHFLVSGNIASPMDIIADMAGGLWGVAFGAALNRLRISSVTKRTLLH